MKLSTRQDVDAPIDWVFAQVSDFAAWERQLDRRGIAVRRIAGDGAGVGTAWRVGFEFRGKPRETDLRVERIDAPNALHLTSQTQGLAGEGTIELVPLSPRRTRMMVAVEMRPTNLPSRVLIQSLKLAKGQINARFEKRLETYAATLNDRHARSS